MIYTVHQCETSFNLLSILQYSEEIIKHLSKSVKLTRLPNHEVREAKLSHCYDLGETCF